MNRGDITVKARVALESSGENIVPWTRCQVLDNERWEIVFDAVPAGGPYRIETYMEYEGWDGLSTTRGDMVHHVGVGDVFVIAGQSNAAGRAKDPIEDAPEIGVSLLRDSGKWDLAAHPLGETTGSVHLGHLRITTPVTRPGCTLRRFLSARWAIPQSRHVRIRRLALLRWWNPAENAR
ncbi:MAG: sialate O-acetylesterase [Eubacteriales bacterium]